MEIWLIIILAAVGFIMELIDISFGMGYGIITPVLLLLGFPPLDVLMVVLLNSAVFGLLGVLFHAAYKHIELKPDSRGFKIGMYLSALGLMGVILGAVLAVNLPSQILRIIIGIIIVLTAIIVLLKKPARSRFAWIETMTFGLMRIKPEISWIKMSALGVVAAFNKGLSGGGFGPITTAGQLLSGVEPKRAVSITALNEFVVSLAGFIVLFFFQKNNGLPLDLFLTTLISGAVAIPLAVRLVHKTPVVLMRHIIGGFSLIMGATILVQGVLGL